MLKKPKKIEPEKTKGLYHFFYCPQCGEITESEQEWYKLMSAKTVFWSKIKCKHCKLYISLYQSIKTK